MKMTYKTISKMAVSKKHTTSLSKKSSLKNSSNNSSRSSKKYTSALVLSGGGMRGFAHLGVLEVLLERGIQPQIIAGTSIGAIVGVCYAAGKSVEEMKDFFLNISLYKILRPRWKSGLLDTKKIIEEILSFAQVSTFEELSIPVIITATDINKGKEKVFSSGNLQQALEASIAIPGIFAPVSIGKTFYVDGGISNPLPVHLIPEVKHIYVVDIAFKFEIITEKSSALSILKNAIVSLQKQSFLHLSRDIIYIKPPLQEFDLFEYSSQARKTMISRGRFAAKKVLDAL